MELMNAEPKTWKNRSPGDLSHECAEVQSGHVEVSVQLARRAWSFWPATPLEDRIGCLLSAKAGLEAARDRLAEGITRETGKPITEAKAEVGAVVAKIDLTIADAREHLAERRPEGNPYPARVRRLARGPAAVIAPFNFPLHLGHGAAVAHLLAGNPVVFKPSPLAGAVAREYGKIMTQAFPSGVFQILQGWSQVARQLASHPEIRAVCFTGSVAAGRALARELADDFSKELALELGGKNAALILADADLDLAAQAVADGMCLTCGQRCNATSRILVDESVAAAFLSRLETALGVYQPGDPLRESTKLGPLISARAVERYQEVLAQPVEWIRRGQVVSQVGGKFGHWVVPALYLAPSDGAPPPGLLHDGEIFAPVAGVYRFRHVDEAVAMHEATPFGLTASVFTRSQEQFERLSDRLAVANLYANLPTTFSPSTLPFGGWKDSGNGRPGGRWFIRFTTVEQAVQWKDWGGPA
jgi:acyl-CoA reductase-like NAD-dependent aldehyde dehydrogenase